LHDDETHHRAPPTRGHAGARAGPDCPARACPACCGHDPARDFPPPRMSTTAILLCAGRGERLAAGVDKALALLAGRPLFTWSLEALERCPAIHAVVVVGPARTLQPALAASGLNAAKVVAWSEGGRERQHSVARGLHHLAEGCTHVAVHDSARALVTP